MNYLRMVGLLCVSLAAAGCAGPVTPLEVVEAMDLDRYVGKWFEIASYPVSFQSGCIGTTAEYSLNSDGTVAVLNSCYEGSFDADVRTASGSARVVTGTNNAKLKVRFFIFEGDYWILELGEDQDYGYAVVGTPKRDMLWILSRTPAMDQELLDGILKRLPQREFDPQRLQFTPQQEEQ